MTIDELIKELNEIKKKKGSGLDVCVYNADEVAVLVEEVQVLQHTRICSGKNFSRSEEHTSELQSQ